MSDGEWLDYTITYLEMNARPTWPQPSAPDVKGLALIRAENPPPRWFLHLYRSVGRDYEWTDWLEKSEEEVAAFVGDPSVSIHTLMLTGWTAGFFMLDHREPSVCDLAYFGLTPEAVGRGLGGWLLRTAILDGWAAPGVERMTVNTCTLDHPSALPLYQRMGFEPVRRENARRRPSVRAL